MDVLRKRPGLRWLAPLLALFVAVTAGLIGSRASADVTLPDLTAEQLLTDVAQAKPAGFSGTVEQTANLGLPDLSGMGGQSGSDFSSLVSGTHTLRVAYGAPDRARIAVQGQYGESALVSDGTQQWLWSSRENSVVHRTGDGARSHDGSGTPPTPADLAQRFLSAVGTSTDVTLAKNVTVADRPAYELVLTPKADQTGTLIRSVRLAVDGQTFVPLRAQVYASADQPVLSTGFTSIDYTVPDAREFTFTPPKDATVTEESGAGREHSDRTTGTERPEATTTGDAWTTVVVSEVGDVSGSGDRQAEQVLQSLPKVSGDWGSGRLLAGTAFSAVLTDDGRLAVGAVTPDLLYAALR